MEVISRFDFNGKTKSFKRTPQGFLRVSARLSKTGVFTYKDGREYRSEEEVFKTDSLESLKGAPVTDLHPFEKGEDNFLTPANAKDHIIGITESIERDGPYLKGSLLIFHADAIEAIESGERKEISLGYKCRLEKAPGSINGESYDAVQRDIIVNHVAIGPKGWGRAGADCSIRTDTKSKSKLISKNKGHIMTDTIRFDGVEINLTADAVSHVLHAKKQQLSEIQGRLDAAQQEIAKQKILIESLNDPQHLNSKVNARLNLIEKFKVLVGDDEKRLDSLNDEELKILAIKKHYPDLDLKDKDQSYINGIFDSLQAKIESTERNDSLGDTRKALHIDIKGNTEYEKWLSYSANLWSLPLSGSLSGGK